MFCTKCGNKIADGAKFCTKCGAPIANRQGGQINPTPANGASASKQEIQKPVQPIVQQVRPVPPSNEVLRQPQPVQSKKKKKGGSIALIIILVVIILALLAGGGFLLYNYFSSQGNDGEKLIEEAEEYMEKEDYSSAIKIYEDILEKDEENIDAYIGLAEAYLGKGEIEEAIELLENANEDLDNRTLTKKISSLTKELEETKEPVTDAVVELPTTGNVIPTTGITEATVAPVQITYTGMEGTIQQLMYDNLFFLDFYTFGSLNTTGMLNNNLLTVSDSRMSTWNEFETFVYNLFIHSRAEQIVKYDNKYWTDGTYVNLFLDPKKVIPTTKSNTVGWEVFTIEIISLEDKKSCKFKVTDAYTGYFVEANAIYENDKWLLEKEIY